MARTRTATLPAAQLPDTATLNKALKSEKFSLVVDPEWGNADHSGYLPCTLAGEDAGFNLTRSTSSEGKLVLSIKWGGDKREQAAAIGVLATLATQFSAEVVDPEAASPFAPEALRKEARGLFQALADEGVG